MFDQTINISIVPFSVWIQLLVIFTSYNNKNVSGTLINFVIKRLSFLAAIFFYNQWVNMISPLDTCSLWRDKY